MVPCFIASYGGLVLCAILKFLLLFPKTTIFLGYCKCVFFQNDNSLHPFSLMFCGSCITPKKMRLTRCIGDNYLLLHDTNGS